MTSTTEQVPGSEQMAPDVATGPRGRLARFVGAFAVGLTLTAVLVVGVFYVIVMYGLEAAFGFDMGQFLDLANFPPLYSGAAMQTGSSVFAELVQWIVVLDILAAQAARKLNGARTLPAAHRSVENLDFFTKLVQVDQEPIGRSPRSNPASYVDLLPLLLFFAALRVADIYVATATTIVAAPTNNIC